MISHGVAEGENRNLMYAIIIRCYSIFLYYQFLSVKIASYISTDFAAQLHEIKFFLSVRNFQQRSRINWDGKPCDKISTSDITNAARIFDTDARE